MLLSFDRYAFPKQLSNNGVAPNHLSQKDKRPLYSALPYDVVAEKNDRTRWPLTERKTTEVISTEQTKMRSIGVHNSQLKKHRDIIEVHGIQS
jgi:hypothetical protein